MALDYMILRTTTRHSPDDAATGFEAFPAHPPSWRRNSDCDIVLQRENLHPSDYVKLQRERSVIGIAPIMPIRLIAPIGEAQPASTGSAPAVSWGVTAVGAAASSLDGDGVCVAVLDTGIDASHPAFAELDLVQKDFTGSGHGDAVGHGTHCAGTIFGRDVDGVRIGVARRVSRVLIGKVLDDAGAGTSDAILDGVRWAVENRAQVVSMSLGYDFPAMVQTLVDDGIPQPSAISQTLAAYRANLRLFDAMMDLLEAQSAFGRDTLVVAASGNESQRPAYTIAASLPAAARGIIAVGAVEQSGLDLRIAAFSNAFPQVCAPGVDILSARPGGGLIEMTGTSMATPHVAGVAALHWQALGLEASAARVTAALIASARTDLFVDDFAPEDHGAGLVTAPYRGRELHAAPSA